MQSSVLFQMSNECENPWNNIRSRSLGSALLLAEKTGHIQHKSDYEWEKKVSEVKEKLPSLNLITLLKEITKKKKEHNKICLEIQGRMEDNETADITHLTVLERKTKQINELNSYLQNVINEKEFLITRLQQPFVGEYIKLEAAYHQFATELFPLVSQTLADLLSHMETVDWVVSADLSHDQFDTVLSHLTSCLAKMQTHFQSLLKMRAGMKLISQQKDSTLE